MHKMLVASLTLAILSGCPEKKEDYKQERPADEPAATTSSQPAPPAKPKKKGPPDDLGTCNLEVTGGVTMKIESKGGPSATNVSYWYTEAERKNMMGVDGYVVNCTVPGARFSLIPGGGTPDGMPFGPKKFTFTKGRGDGATAMIAFGQQTVSDANGTVEITALDKRHIAGTVDLTGKVVPGNKQVKITGSFDLICPGLSNCEWE